MNIDIITKKFNGILNKLKKSSNKKIDKADKKNKNIPEVLIIDPTIKLISELQGDYCSVNRPKHWISIVYYEQYHMLARFSSNEFNIIVNNSNDSSTLSKFCIGSLKGKRQLEQFKIGRHYIGNGIRLNFDGYDISVTNLSTKNIFVHPLGLNLYYNKPNLANYRVPPRRTLLIYDNNCFQQLLLKYIQNNYQNVRILENTCKIRISFTRGWGEGHLYNDITTVPCWLELTLHCPIEILNTVLGPSPPRRPSPIDHSCY